MACVNHTGEFTIDTVVLPAPEVGDTEDHSFGDVVSTLSSTKVVINRPLLPNTTRTYDFKINSTEKAALVANLLLNLGKPVNVLTHVSEAFSCIVLNPETVLSKDQEDKQVCDDFTPIGGDVLDSVWSVSLTLLIVAVI